MTASLPPIKGRLIVAVAFDDKLEALTQTAAALARRFGLAVRFVHVAQPDFDPGLDGYGPGGVVVPVAMRQAQERAYEDATAKMNDFVRSLKLTVPLDGKVLQGPATEGLIAEAVSSQAKLILCAGKPREYRFMPSGMSVALTLMQMAPVPVLVISDAPLLAGDGPLKILLADDLNEDTKGAVRKTYQLAAKFPKSRVRHVHVHGDFREVLRDRWDELRARLPVMEGIYPSVDDLWLGEYEARLQAMRQRGGAELEAAEKAGVKADLDVRTGQVEREIDAATEDFGPDLVVFGRHKVWRARPFLIGRMSYRAMLEARRPVLTVPPLPEPWPTDWA